MGTWWKNVVGYENEMRRLELVKLPCDPSFCWSQRNWGFSLLEDLPVIVSSRCCGWCSEADEPGEKWRSGRGLWTEPGELQAASGLVQTNHLSINSWLQQSTCMLLHVWKGGGLQVNTNESRSAQQVPPQHTLPLSDVQQPGLGLNQYWRLHLFAPQPAVPKLRPRLPAQAFVSAHTQLTQQPDVQTSFQVQ